MKYKDGKKEIEAEVQVKLGDTNYIKLYQMKLLAGSNLSQSDTIKELIINETCAHIFGFQQPQQAVGKYIDWNDSQSPIVGVVADFNQHSLHEPVKPLLISTRITQMRNFNIALQPQNEAGTTWKTAIGKIEKAFRQV